ncbi:MAG: hypothetical protein ACQESP_13560 [Candidatus Muiribacteriota bacterium]
MIKKNFYLFFILLFFSFLSSCGNKYHKAIDPVISDPASEILKKIKKINSESVPLKGLAELRVKSEQEIKEYNIAYASDGKSKFRIEVLSPIGMPVLTIAYDGDTLFINEDGSSKIKTYSNPDKVIQKITSIDFNINFLPELICSKIIIIDFNKADVKKNKLILSRNNIDQEINFDKDFFSGYQFFLKKNNNDLYQVVFYDNKNFDIISRKKNAKLSFFKKTAVPLKNIGNSNIFRLTR